jgi:hypothetical protein
LPARTPRRTICCTSAKKVRSLVIVDARYELRDHGTSL